MQVQLENNQYMYSFDSFDMHAINYILFCTVYFDLFDMK